MFGIIWVMSEQWTVVSWEGITGDHMSTKTITSTNDHENLSNSAQHVLQIKALYMAYFSSM